MPCMATSCAGAYQLQFARSKYTYRFKRQKDVEGECGRHSGAHAWRRLVVLVLLFAISRSMWAAASMDAM